MEWTRINLDASPSAAPTIEVSDGAPASLWCNPPRAAGTSASHTNEVRVVEWSAFSKQMTYLGEGEFATAHRVLLDGTPVAVKALKKSKTDDQDALAGLKREVMFMTHMRHANVLPGLALGQTADGQPFMLVALLENVISRVMPRDAAIVPFWVRWRELRRWPLKRALKYACELAAALRYCHHEAFPSIRVLHRDIKPNNIGLLADDTLVLFDFGLASLWSDNNDAGVHDDAPRKLTGQTGSLRYMSPEVALSRPYNHKADVFSFATVIWELCAHRKPFEDLSPEVFMRAIANGHRPKIPKAWPTELRELLTSCWADAHAARPDCRAIVPTLERLRDNAAAAAMGKEKRKTRVAPGLPTAPRHACSCYIPSLSGGHTRLDMDAMET